MLDSTFYLIFIIGIIISVGFIAGKLFQKYKIPRVLAFVLVGIFLGSAGIISPMLLDKLYPLVEIALGFIGFAIGNELNIKDLIKGSKKIFVILICESMFAFGLVTVLFYVVFGQLYIALIFGALASATAPAATIEVIREYKAKGELTQMIFVILALDDIIAVFLFSFVTIYVSPQAVWNVISFLMPLLEIVFAFLLGGVLGFVFAKIEEMFKNETEWVILTFASVLLCTSISNIFGLSSILSNMALGISMANIHSKKIKMFEEKLEIVLLPIFIGFFVLTGAHLNILILIAVIELAAIYVCARTIGKFFGSYGGAKLANSSSIIKNYLGLSLLSQAGVAIGLAYLANKQLTMMGDPMMGLLIFNVITAAVLITELIGPLCVKYSLHKAKECEITT